MNLTDEEWRQLQGYAAMRQKGVGHHAAVAAVNLVLELDEKPALTDALVKKLAALDK